MIDRIVLDREEIAGLIRGARLLELRVDTPPEVRERRLATATTAMDALCGLSQREGTNAVWDVLEMLDRRELAGLLHADGERAERDGVLGAGLTLAASSTPIRGGWFIACL